MRLFLRYLRDLFPVPRLAFAPVSRVLRSMVVLPLGLSLLPQPAVIAASAPAEIEPALSAQQIADTLTAKTDLPIASVEIASDADDQGVVVFLPQYHRYPGSKVEDKRNDPGFAAQQELYAILKQTVEDAGIDTVFVEGEYVGAVADTNRDELSQRIVDLKTFEGQLAQAKTVLGPYMSPEDLERLLAQAEATADHARRGIVLEGGPEKLWAEGADIVLYGTENAETREASAELVRQHVYLQDRMRQMTKTGSRYGSASQLFELFSDDLRTVLLQRLLSRQDTPGVSSSDQLHQLLTRLGYGAQESSPAQALSMLEEVKAGLPADSAEAGVFVETFKGSWEALLHEPRVNSGTTSKIPARTDNPYQHIEDKDELRRLMQDNERQIEEVVVERRNGETAETVAQTMRDQGEEVVVLQFGAGHEDGLVQALRAQNLSVVTVTPQVVAEGRQVRE